MMESQLREGEWIPEQQRRLTVPTASGRMGKVLLIGGTGYVGETMRQRIRDAGYRVRLLIRSEADRAMLEEQGFETAIGDVSVPNSLVTPFHGVDSVINLVAIVREKGNATFENMNYQGSVNVTEAARQAGVRRLIKMSALGAANLPAYPYLQTKWRAENHIKDSGLYWTIFQPSIIFGPSPANHFQFVSQLANVVRRAPLTPVVGDGTALFQPIHLNDVSDAFIRALNDSGTVGHTYEIGGPEVMTYEQIIEEVQRTLNRRRKTVHINATLMGSVSAVLDFIPLLEAPATRQQIRMLKLDNVTANNAIEMLIGRPPIPLRGNIDYIRQK